MSNMILQLMAIMLPIVALLAVPKALKWTTKGMSALAGGALGAIGGKMGAAGRGMGKQAKKQGQKGVKYGQEKTAEFGKTKLAEKGFGTKSWNNRQKNKASEASRAKSRDEIADLNKEDLTTSAERAAVAAARNPTSYNLGVHRAHLDRLAETSNTKGLEAAARQYRDAGRAEGMTDDTINANWQRDLGKNIPAMAKKNPMLSGHLENLGSRATNLVAVTGGHGAGEDYHHTTQGDYSDLGEERLKSMDPTVLKDIVTSMSATGAVVTNFKFDKATIARALSSRGGTGFEDTGGRKALEEIYAKI